MRDRRVIAWDGERVTAHYYAGDLAAQLAGVKSFISASSINRHAVAGPPHGDAYHCRQTITTSTPASGGG